MNKDMTFHAKDCHQCGKEFIVHDADEWVFKRSHYGQRLFFCSWSCIKKYDADHSCTKIEKRERVVSALKKGVPISKIVERYGADYAMVKYWKKKLETASQLGEEEDECLQVQGF